MIGDWPTDLIEICYVFLIFPILSDDSFEHRTQLAIAQSLAEHAARNRYISALPDECGLNDTYELDDMGLNDDTIDSELDHMLVDWLTDELFDDRLIEW